FCGRVDGIEVFAGPWRDEFAVNEKRVAGADSNVVICLGRGSIVPFVSKTQTTLGRWEGTALIERLIVTDNDDAVGASISSWHKVLLIFSAKRPQPHAKRTV